MGNDAEVIDSGQTTKESRLRVQLSWKISHKKLLCWLAGVEAIMVVAFFLTGFDSRFGVLVLLGLFVSLAVLAIAVICLVRTVGGVIKRQPVVSFTVIWVFLFLIVLRAPNDYSRWGGLANARMVGPEDIVRDGRALMQVFRESGDNDEYGWQLPPSDPKVPESIRRLRPVYVWVHADSVGMKMYGFGDWAGFYVKPEGMEGLGIKIVDGLYWDDPGLMY